MTDPKNIKLSEFCTRFHFGKTELHPWQKDVLDYFEKMPKDAKLILDTPRLGKRLMQETIMSHWTRIHCDNCKVIMMHCTCENRSTYKAMDMAETYGLHPQQVSVKDGMVIIDDPFVVKTSDPVMIDFSAAEVASTFKVSDPCSQKGLYERRGDYLHFGGERRLWRKIPKNERKRIEEILKDQNENKFSKKFNR